MKPLTKILKLILPAALAFGFTGNAMAQTDQINKFIDGMLQMHRNKTLCVKADASIDTIRNELMWFLKTAGVQGSVAPKQLAMAMWTIYPCPFTPIRKELRPATQQDIEGVWLFPETSQKLRFPPQSTKQAPTGRLPVKCDAVGYYPEGELRHAVIAGQHVTCPFKKTSDLDIARKHPNVVSWAFQRNRIVVTRTDVQNHIEEWDAFVVTTPFTHDDVQFSAGDLVAYVRKENGNEVGIATQFRHLKRLP